MRSDLLSPQNAETKTQHPGMKLQNGKMLKVALDGEMMVPRCDGGLPGQHAVPGVGASGVGQFVKQQLTGEGVPLMRCTGAGDVFLADLASDIHLIDLEGGHDGLTINGKNVLAFEPMLSYDIRRVQGAGVLSNAGLFNCVFSGQGRIAITTKGPPVILQVDQPTYADPQAAVASSASPQTGFHRADQFGLGTLIGRSTGEAFTMSFNGQGFVVVQPSEEVPGRFVGGTGGGQQAGQAGSAVAGVLGNFLGR
ncbi:AIM24 family protein [Mycobacterium sp. ITM-2016-00318]|uniref:AIM24 family protein n=1 Tax=Mycobacterium sp. ITM-2016-00318 TaxID=2099693 RepID=UPI0026931827|nr:AIM24 family protein [Mycobacterium sp. ITM-2016-00318]WNG93968.1 AIM24 family protein [Mycobacterium sp. ITM-2016-00318]